MNIDESTCLLSQVKPLIEVRAPYFSLESLHRQEGGWFIARIPIQCFNGYEKTLMDTSEVGRHLAILGSCVGALQNLHKAKHYYLAYEAQLSTYPNYISDSRPDFLYARASASFVGKRELVAHAELLDLVGNVSACLMVKYRVMKERVFDRMYSNATTEILPIETTLNPYCESVPMETVGFTQDTMVTTIGEVEAYRCLGHFEAVRALPVAILSQCFLNSSYQLLRNVLHDDQGRFALISGELNAAKLALAGQALTVSTHLVKRSQQAFVLENTASDQTGDIVGTMTSSIKRV